MQRSKLASSRCARQGRDRIELRQHRNAEFPLHIVTAAQAPIEKQFIRQGTSTPRPSPATNVDQQQFHLVGFAGSERRHGVADDTDVGVIARPPGT